MSSQPNPQLVVPPGFEDDARQIAQLAAQQHRDPSAIAKRIQILERVLSRLTPNEHPEFRAAVLNDLGNAYSYLPTEDREANLRRAIICYEAALTIYTLEATPLQYAMTHNNLGTVYNNLPGLDREANLQQAIAYYEAALTVFTRESAPLDYAMTQNNLGTAYRNLPTGDREANLKRAIACYSAALTVYTPEVAPTQYAGAQNNLGNAYRDLPTGDREANLQQAITCYEASLTIYTLEATPLQYAGTQNNLGNAYRDLPTEDQEANLQRAITCFETALSVYTLEATPLQYAGTQNNMGNAYQDLPTGDREANLRRAITCYEAALTVYTLEAAPLQYALTQNNLGNAYNKLPGGDREANLQRAIAYYEAVLTIYAPEAAPLDYATTQNNLGNAYQDLPTGDREANLKRAIACYESALRFRTPETAPLLYASTQNNLGTVYSNLPTGDREANLQRAIACYEAALRFRTPEAAPLDYAMTQNNLGTAYRNLPTGDREANLQQAIICFEHALTVYSREATPLQYAGTQNNLGNAYINLPTGDREANLRRAITCYDAALTVYTPEAAPYDYATTQNNLGTVYGNLLTGDLEANLQRAIACYESALTVYAPNVTPLDYAMAQNNLGNAYRDLPTGDREANLQRAINCYESALTLQTAEAFPASHRMTSRNLANLHFSERRWETALIAYQTAIRAGHYLFAASATEAGRRAEVGETEQLYARAAFCLLQTNRPAEALVMHESGKTRLLAEALALGEADLSALPRSQQKKVSTARRSIHVLEAELRLPSNHPTRRSDFVLGDLLREARAGLDSLIDSIRVNHPGFMPTGLDLPRILALIPEDGALVAPLVTSQGSAVFVVPTGVKQVTEEHVVWIDDFKEKALSELLRGPKDDPEWGGWMGAYLKYRRAGTPLTLEAWQATIAELSKQIGEALFKPVRKRLKMWSVKHVLLMSSGGLQLLPLHTAFIDKYVVSYEPSAYTLSVSRRRAAQRTGETALVVGINVYRDPQIKQLVNAVAEAEAVAGLLKTEALIDSQATKEPIIAQSKACAYLHLSCHGYFSWSDPLASGLICHDNVLTLSDIIGQPEFKALRLVVLSACETGITDVRQSPDEYIGLPAGFLQAGAPAVVSSLWTVDDRSTALLMERFYRNHLEKHMDFAAALREAQLWLRDTTREEIGDYYKSFLVTRMSESEAAEQATRITLAGEPNDKPFFHPYYWAAFTFTGA